MGTVADVMKLLGENRTIVRVGLNHLKKPAAVGCTPSWWRRAP
ncbi:MAG: hypothetical protein ACLR1T_11545 [Evtepia gabavorous]